MGADVAERRPLRADAQRNYDKIVKVAAEAFAEKGTGASLDDIACRAGVGPGTLYRHFPTRDALLAAALHDSLGELADAARRLSVEADAGAALDEWILVMARHLRTYAGLPDSIGAAFAGGEADSPLRTTCMPMQSGTRELVRRAKEAGVIRADVEASDVAALIGSIAWAAERRNDSDETLVRLVRVVSEGLR
ncbi:MAG: TetR/AcrR family transcriptional regulator [Microbacteriaceae bacterium]|nr:TetR/AcrR family transcriptional regulator [Microbacteriaceae bacterium]MCL2793803.1 TetR/AcrR family transcriptional regulator [Microbacteriaceae bacterium]